MRFVDRFVFVAVVASSALAAPTNGKHFTFDQPAHASTSRSQSSTKVAKPARLEPLMVAPARPVIVENHYELEDSVFSSPLGPIRGGDFLPALQAHEAGYIKHPAEPQEGYQIPQATEKPKEYEPPAKLEIVYGKDVSDIYRLVASLPQTSWIPSTHFPISKYTLQEAKINEALLSCAERVTRTTGKDKKALVFQVIKRNDRYSCIIYSNQAQEVDLGDWHEDTSIDTSFVYQCLGTEEQSESMGSATVRHTLQRQPVSRPPPKKHTVKVIIPPAPRLKDAKSAERHSWTSPPIEVEPKPESCGGSKCVIQ